MDDDEEHGARDECAQDGDGAAKKKKPRKRKKKNAKESEEAGLGVEEPVGEEPRFELSENDAPKEWVDITKICDLASQGMKLGEMIESPHFRLFDAMSAIEIMDPKMDSGYNNSEDMTLARAEESGVLPQQRPVPYEDLVAIWDQLLMYYLLWLDGHTIVQTVFCCLYLQDLQKHVKPTAVFGAFVDALLCACRRARHLVLRAGIYDDEDFMPSMFGIDLEACVISADPKEVRKGIDAAHTSLAGDKSPCADELAWRLEFLGDYVSSLVELGDEAPAGQGAKAKTMDRARRRLASCLSLIERLPQKSAANAPPGALRCFDPSINRRLLVPGPPRTVEPIQDPQVVQGMWKSHLNGLLLCCDFSQKNLAQLLDGSAATCRDEPNVLPRSIAQICNSEEGLLRNLLLDSLSLCLFPREALQHCKKPVELFLSHCMSLFAHMLKLANANMARRFRRLAHVFSEFNALQHEAWQLDEDLKKTFGANLRHARPCWVWIMERCLQAMITKLFLGFELDLYDEAEFHMIYWYVDYLYGLRIYNLNELYHSKEQPLGGPKKKSAATRKDERQQQAGLRGGLRPRSPPAFLLLMEATQSAVRGLFRLLAFCLRQELLQAPPATVDGLAQRFVLRFRSLEHFRLPHLPSFRDFEQSSASAQAPVDSRVVLDAAGASFAEAGQLLEKVAAAKEKGDAASQDPSQESARALKRVVVANQLAVTKLSKLLDVGRISRKHCKVSASLTHHVHLVSVQAQEMQPAS